MGSIVIAIPRILLKALASSEEKGESVACTAIQFAFPGLKFRNVMVQKCYSCPCIVLFFA